MGISTKNKLKQNNTMSTKAIKVLQTERKTYHQQIRNLKQENKNLQLKLNSTQKESDFTTKCIENETNLKEMNHRQTQQKYDELILNHTNNMRNIHLFLN